MISEKLLSEVFGKEVNSFIIVDEDIDNHNSRKVLFQFKDVYYRGVSGIEDEEINIHELVYKCKEWAYTQDYEINTYKTIFDLPYRVVLNENWECDNNGTAPYSVSDYENYKKTEAEAIFDGCEWILENSNPA